MQPTNEQAYRQMAIKIANLAPWNVHFPRAILWAGNKVIRRDLGDEIFSQPIAAYITKLLPMDPLTSVVDVQGLEELVHPYPRLSDFVGQKKRQMEKILFGARKYRTERFRTSRHVEYMD